MSEVQRDFRQFLETTQPLDEVVAWYSDDGEQWHWEPRPVPAWVPVVLWGVALVAAVLSLVLFVRLVAP